MPEADVSEVMLNADVAGESFVVIRRAETVGQNGVAVLAATSHLAWGSVTPTGDNSMLREEAFTAQQKTIKVITSFRLRGVSEQIDGVTYQPDVILWDREHFIVRVLDDYSRYGAGQVEAECSSIDYVGPPPSPPAGNFVF